MIGLLVLKLVGLGVPAKLAKPLLFGAAAVLLLVALVGLKSCYDADVVKQDRLERENKVLKRTAKANEKAAEQRATDVQAIEVQLKELTDAQVETGDGLSARQRRGCIILRQQGRDLSTHPTCRRLKVD